MVHSGTALLNPYKIFEKIKLASGMKVADFGCGSTGHFVFPSAKIVGEKGTVYAVDIQKSVLTGINSLARSEGYDNVHTIWSDIELPQKTTVPTNSLDVVFFVNVLFQLKSKPEALTEAARLLKKNGFLVIIDWSKQLGMLGPSDTELAKPEIVKQVAMQIDLNLNEESQLNDYHYLLIFKKS